MLAPSPGKKNNWSIKGAVSRRHLKVSCSIWLQDVRSKSFKAFMLQGGLSMDWTCSSNISLRCSIRLWSGEFGGQGTTFEVFVMFLKPFLSIFSVWHYSAKRGHCHRGIQATCQECQAPRFPSRTLPSSVLHPWKHPCVFSWTTTNWIQRFFFITLNLTFICTKTVEV